MIFSNGYEICDKLDSHYVFTHLQSLTSSACCH